ncbi:MAG: DUF3568 family protein [bacterium]|nr:DUF3568 family protein [bacterium]
MKILPIIALTLAASTSSCIVAAVGAAAGYIQYDNNEGWKDYTGSIDQVFSATQKALTELGYSASEAESSDPTKRLLEADGLKLSIAKQTDEVIRVRVRVGTFKTDDHKRQAQLILDGIDKQM